jgi:hypothetical protein
MEMEKVIKLSETEYEIRLDEPTHTISFKINKEFRKSLDNKYKNFSDLVRKSLAEQIECITERDLLTLNKLKGNQVASFRLKQSELQKLDKEAKRLKVTRTDLILMKLGRVVIANEVH